MTHIKSSDFTMLTERDRITRVMYYVSCFFVAFTLLLLVLMYFFHINLLETNTPCYFLTLTGYYCPACGGSHAFLYLIQGNIVKSFQSNPFVLYLLLTGGWFFLSQTMARLTRNRFHGMHFRVLYVYLGIAILLLNCLIQNLLLHHII